MRTIPAGEFKAKCLAVMDEVQATGRPVLVTKRGRPVVRLTPATTANALAPDATFTPTQVQNWKPEAVSQDKKSIFGRLRHLGAITGDIVSSEQTDEEWDRLFDEKWARFEKASAK